MNIQPDSTSSLADHGAVFKSLVDTFNGIVFHANEETWAQLGMRSSSIEESRRGMSEVTFRHEVIGLKDSIDVGTMNTNSNTHDHVLGSFSHTTVDTKQIWSLEGFESEAII